MLQNIQLQVFPLAIQHCIQMAGSSAQQQQSGRELWMQEDFGIGATNHVPGATEHVPIVEVAFANGKWWSIPQEMSSQLYEKYVQDQDAVYTWDWGEGGRIGSWTPDGEETNINRYKIDFLNCVQENLDNQRKRSIRVVWVRPQDVEARFTGQLPSQA